MSEETDKDLKELREFLDSIEPAVDTLQKYYGGSHVEAFHSYLLLGIISDLKTFRSEVTEGGTFPMGALSQADVELFMRTIGEKPN